MSTNSGPCAWPLRIPPDNAERGTVLSWRGDFAIPVFWQTVRKSINAATIVANYRARQNSAVAGQLLARAPRKGWLPAGYRR